MSRTPGRVAFDAFYAHLYLPAERVAADLNFDREGASGPWQAAANAVIEECAKVAEAEEQLYREKGIAARDKGLNVAADIQFGLADGILKATVAIRSLKTSTGETE